MPKVLSYLILAIVFCLAGPALMAQVDSVKAVKNDAESMATDKIESELTADAEICAEVIDRMPSGVAKNFPADIGKVCLWSKIYGASDTTVVFHVWYYGKKEMARVELPVKSNAWRTYTTKRIQPSWTGDWRVEIEDNGGKTIKTVIFKIGGIE